MAERTPLRVLRDEFGSPAGLAEFQPDDTLPISTVSGLQSALDGKVDTASLGAVATSNDYNDLDNLPTLGTAAATDAADYATAAQGGLADSAVQPADLAAVATTGAYADLSGLPTLGTAAATAATDYATAAQGGLADTALQPGDIGTTVQAYDADTAKLDVAQTWAGAQRFGAGTSAKMVAMGGSAIDLALGNGFTKTISGATTLSLSNVPATGLLTIWLLELTNGGSAAVTWWSGIAWAEGSPPTLTASGRDVLGFYTSDGGTNTVGFVVGLGV